MNKNYPCDIHILMYDSKAIVKNNSVTYGNGSGSGWKFLHLSQISISRVKSEINAEMFNPCIFDAMKGCVNCCYHRSAVGIW